MYSDVEKDAVNWQTKTQRNCNVIYICSQNGQKNDVLEIKTLLEASVFKNWR